MHSYGPFEARRGGVVVPPIGNGGCSGSNLFFGYGWIRLVVLVVSFRAIHAMQGNVNVHICQVGQVIVDVIHPPSSTTTSSSSSSRCIEATGAGLWPRTDEAVGGGISPFRR